MALNTVFSWFIKKRAHQIDLFKKYPLEVQTEVFQNLIETAKYTEFGRRHSFDQIKTLEDFKRRVPVATYTEFAEDIERMRMGAENVLWPGKIKWFAKSSGTTSHRSKFIPVSEAAIEECHHKGGKDLLALYYLNNPQADIYGGKTLVMGGSSRIHELGRETYSGDLSAIIIQHLPFWVNLRRTPSLEIALMDNWEKKIEAMAQATKDEDVRMITGVPSWTLVLINRILEITGKKYITDVWPNFEVFMHGGVSFKPYKHSFEALVGNRPLNYLETYNASEGFFGIQDRLGADDMLLMLDYGIYYEFMPLDQLGKESPLTFSLKEVQVGPSYALIISSNGGLWRYMVGDTIRFTSIAPYRIQVSGRTQHFINAFGEELIVDNADTAIRAAAQKMGVIISDYTAAPVFMEGKSQGRHEWLIEFDQLPTSLTSFRQALDDALKEVNTDYEAKRSFDLALLPPLVRAIPKGSFYQWLKTREKLGGQNKVPRLSNERVLIESILAETKVIASC